MPNFLVCGIGGNLSAACLLIFLNLEAAMGQVASVDGVDATEVSYVNGGWPFIHRWRAFGLVVLL